MSNSDQKWRPFIPCIGITHPGFPHKGKPIELRTRPIKGPLNKKNQKESNKLLENKKGILISLPKGRE